MPAFRLGYNTNGFAHHRLDDALRILAESGYRAVGITPDVHHLPPFETSATELRRVRRLLEELDLAPVIETGARYVLDPRRKHRPNLLDPSAEARRTRIEFLLRCAEIASEVGARVVSTWAGTRPPETDAEHADRYLEEGLAVVCEGSDRLGVAVAFEPEPGMHVESLAQWDRLKAAVDLPNLGLTLDVGHVPCTEDIPPHDVLRQRANELLNIHLDDCRGGVHEHLQIGEGELDWPAIRAALTASEYSHLACFELSRHSHAAPAAARVAIQRFGSY